MTTITTEDIYMLEQLRQTFQRHRIQMSNRISAVDRGASAMQTATMQRYMERFQALEDEAAGDIAVAVKDHEMWPWLKQVKGIGPGLAGSLLAMIDIEKADTVSALWRFAGQAVNGDGKAEKPTKGEKLPYNANLKRVCYLISTSFLRANSPYRREYDEAKEYYQRVHADWTPGHIDMAARRKMTKLFLSHLWVEWRTRRGLPVRAPYAMQVLGHDGYKGSPVDGDSTRR